MQYKSGSCYANSRAQLDWGVVVPQGLLLQHSQFQSLYYPFFWENNHKNHHTFPRAISQPGNVETTLWPTRGNLVLHRTPPPRKRASFGDASLKKPNAWSVAGSSTLRPGAGVHWDREKILPNFFLLRGRFGCWRSSILTQFFGDLLYSHLTSTFFLVVIFSP